MPSKVIALDSDDISSSGIITDTTTANDSAANVEGAAFTNSDNDLQISGESSIHGIEETGTNTTDTRTNSCEAGLAGIEDSEEMGNKGFKCGWFNFRPKCIQRFMSAKWALFWLCWAGSIQGLVVNGFINVVITTIERRFGLRSSQTGLIASGYDISSFICLVPVTYFGGRLGASKPRWIGIGLIIMATGAFTFALPHFLVGDYRATTADHNTCVIGAGVTNRTSHQDCSMGNNYPEAENISWNVWIFFLAQLLLGIGASPLFTLAVTYIDENVSKKMSSVYLGIYYTLTIIGPAMGYVVGGQLLLLYTDFLTVDSTTLGLTPESKVWVGAWWVGFAVMAVVCLLLAIPILGFPPAMPDSERLQQIKESEAYRGGAESNQTFTKLREIPKALCALLKNPTFFFLNLAGASEGLVISGFAVFLPKHIENQFSVTAVWAALMIGVIVVTAGAGATFLGGYLVKRLQLSCSGIIRLCLFSTLFATLFTMCFFLSCPNLTFAGVTAPYNEILEEHDLEDTNYKTETVWGNQLINACNTECSCNSMKYEPICGVDGMMYYSPCHAGCEIEINLETSKVFQNCSCISNPQKESVYDAVNTMCASQCGYLWVFIVICFFTLFFTFLATMPALSATLRCVHDKQRSFALGIQWIKVRLLGTIPAPMVFGTLIDATCILWEDSCDDDHGACLVYDNKFMSRYILGLGVFAKFCSIVFFFAAWYFYIPPLKAKTIAEDNAQMASNNNDQHHVITENGDHPETKKY